MAFATALGIGGKLEVSTDDVTYNDVGLVTSINPDISIEAVDSTHLQSTSPYTEAIPGLATIDVSCDVNWDPSSAEHKATLLDYINTSLYFKITWGDTTVWKIQGFFTGISPTQTAPDKMTASVTIRVTGVPDFNFT